MPIPTVTKRRGAVFWFYTAACAFSILSSVTLSFIPWSHSLEESIGLRTLFKLRGPKPSPQEAVIVAINANTAEALDLPNAINQWPRSTHATLINTISEYGAAGIVLDIAFINPSQPTEDEALAHSIKKAGNVILFSYLKRYQISLPSSQTLAIEERHLPISELADAAAGIAGFTLAKAPYRVNQAPLYSDSLNDSTQSKQRVQPTQPMIALQLYANTSLTNNEEDKNPPLTKGHSFRNSSLMIAPNTRKAKLALSQASQLPNMMYINFYGPIGQITTLPYETFFRQTSSGSTDHTNQIAKLIKNKMVFVGFSDAQITEQKDTYYTVFSNEYGVDLSGVEISATVFGNLLHQSYLTPLTPWRTALLYSLWCIVCILIAAYRNHTWRIPLQIAVPTALLLLATLFFKYKTVWLPIANPILILLPLSHGFIYSWRYWKSKARGQVLSHALNFYVPPTVTGNLRWDKRQFQERHQLVKGICLLSDITGYTKLSEHYNPEQLHRILNQYYTQLITVIEASDGIIANIVGDGMMAIWTEEDASSALKLKVCEAALSIVELLENTRFENITLPSTIGIHYGAFSLGNLGGQHHFEYAPVGDTINTTTRIQGLNNTLKTKVLVSEAFAKDLQTESNFIKLKHLGKFQVKNKKEKLVLFELQRLQTQ